MALLVLGPAGRPFAAPSCPTTDASWPRPCRFRRNSNTSNGRASETARRPSDPAAALQVKPALAPTQGRFQPRCIPTKNYKSVGRPRQRPQSSVSAIRRRVMIRILYEDIKYRSRNKRSLLPDLQMSPPPLRFWSRSSLGLMKPSSICLNQAAWSSVVLEKSWLIAPLAVIWDSPDEGCDGPADD